MYVGIEAALGDQLFFLRRLQLVSQRLQGFAGDESNSIVGDVTIVTQVLVTLLFFLTSIEKNGYVQTWAQCRVSQ